MLPLLAFLTIKSNNILNAGISREEIIGNSMLMLLAGYETTSGAMQFLAYNLAVYKECQEKLREEIKDIVKQHVSRDFMLKFEVCGKCNFWIRQLANTIISFNFTFIFADKNLTK